MSASTYGYNGNNPFVSIHSVNSAGYELSPAESRQVIFNGEHPFTVNCPAVFTNNLEVKTINGVIYGESGGTGVLQDLFKTLVIGNDARYESILNLNNLQCTTINGLPVPVISGGSTTNLSETLTNGNDATNHNIVNVGNLQCATINGLPVPISGGGGSSTMNLSETLANGNDGANQNIVGINNIQCTSINGEIYNPVGFSQNLQETLTIGNNAGGLAMNNVGLISCNGFQLNSYPTTFPAVGSTFKYTLPTYPIPTTGMIQLSGTGNLVAGMYMVNIACQLTATNGLSMCSVIATLGSQSFSSQLAGISPNLTPISTALLSCILISTGGQLPTISVGGTSNTSTQNYSFTSTSNASISRIA